MVRAKGGSRALRRAAERDVSRSDGALQGGREIGEERLEGESTVYRQVPHGLGRLRVGG